jgi:putative peptidoglycan lipid II flippase
MSPFLDELTRLAKKRGIPTNAKRWPKSAASLSFKLKAHADLLPMAGVLVLSAWSLGILNSHRRFFIPYVAPVLWNGAMIATLVWFGGRLDSGGLVVAVAWGALIGGALQFGIQLPWLLRLERDLRISLATRLGPVREAIANAGPAILGRGVVQLSGWVDMVLASLLAVGGRAAFGYAQTLYVLPASLFGMSGGAAELP